MTYLFAPMEGLTGRVYRRVHRRFYPGVDRYYAPFYSPTADQHFNPKSMTELQPTENPGVPLVPQLLTNRAPDFLWAAAALGDLGYREVNLNLGCPSGTVVAKRKGAGFLGLPEELDAFLEAVFSSPVISGLRISVKTRLGLRDPAEFPALLDIFRKYPISLLIVHPRVRTDMYTGPVKPDCFAAAKAACPFPLAWNGDLFTPADVAALLSRFPDTDTLMLGRGLIAEPGLVDRIRTGEACDRDRLKAFHDALCAEYRSVLYGDTALCHRMKELWAYLIRHFEDDGRHFKRLCKATSCRELMLAAEAVFAELPLLPDAKWS